MNTEPISPRDWSKRETKSTRQDRSVPHSSARRDSKVTRPPSGNPNWFEVAVAIVAKHQPCDFHELQARMFAYGATDRQANETIIRACYSGRLKRTFLGQIVLPGYKGRAPVGRTLTYIFGMSLIVVLMLWGYFAYASKTARFGLGVAAAQSEVERIRAQSNWHPEPSKETSTDLASPPPVPNGNSVAEPTIASSITTSGPNGRKPTKRTGSGERRTAPIR